MSSSPAKLIALDVGERRIGVAMADTMIRIATPHSTLTVDGTEIDRIRSLVDELSAQTIVVGFPRNLQGEETAQTQYAKNFAKNLEGFQAKIVFQDESLTSVLAEERLKAQKKQYGKEDIDAYAAAIILNDYLESTYAAGV